MSVRSNIKKLYNNLKPTQKKIADYMLSLSMTDLDASIEEYARKVGTSVASISRFCNKIGYESFQTLKISLSRELRYEPEVVLPIFDLGDDAELSIRKAFSEAVTNLEATEQAVNFSELRAVSNRIIRSKRMYFFGLGGSGGVGYLGELFFSHIGYTAKAISDPYSMSVSAGHVSTTDTVIGLSHTGRTREVVEAMKTARSRGAYTVGITNYPRSPLASITDSILITACQEHKVHFAQSNSMVVQLTAGEQDRGDRSAKSQTKGETRRLKSLNTLFIDKKRRNKNGTST
jgi:DNA-binding MurR/RpiR family transcriptional regulator